MIQFPFQTETQRLSQWWCKRIRCVGCVLRLHRVGCRGCALHTRLSVWHCPPTLGLFDVEVSETLPALVRLCFYLIAGEH